MLGAVFAYSEKSHLGLDLLPQKLGPAGHRRLSLCSDFAGGLFALSVLLIGGSMLVQLTWELKQTTAVLGIPMAWVYVVLPLSGALIVYYSVVSFIGNLKETGS